MEMSRMAQQQAGRRMATATQQARSATFSKHIRCMLPGRRPAAGIGRS